jgi:hypothetical protein
VFLATTFGFYYYSDSYDDSAFIAVFLALSSEAFLTGSEVLTIFLTLSFESDSSSADAFLPFFAGCLTTGVSS